MFTIERIVYFVACLLIGVYGGCYVLREPIKPSRTAILYIFGVVIGMCVVYLFSPCP